MLLQGRGASAKHDAHAVSYNLIFISFDFISCMLLQGRGASAKLYAHARCANSARVGHRVSYNLIFISFDFISLHASAGPWRQRQTLCTRPKRKFGARRSPSKLQFLCFHYQL